GHAFATEGLLMGPILAEFRDKRESLAAELLEIYTGALAKRGLNTALQPAQKITAQGGIGTGQENDFLLDHYRLDATGWGSPFLIVPMATRVDENTLDDSCAASPGDYYLSHASPLGVPLNHFRRSSS